MVEKIVIEGGIPLKGEVTVSGAKNAAVAIIPAAILCSGSCKLENLPYIEDVRLLSYMLDKIGADVTLTEDGKMLVDTSGVSTYIADFKVVKRMRASYYLLGVLLGKFGKAEILLPGGCAIGTRPIDQHIKGMRALGANVDVEYGRIIAEAPNGLKGAEIFLDIVSVGATINIMLAAVLAEGRTTIVNAAKEPHVVDTANFLNCMGARITGAGTDIIKIRGVKQLHGTEYSIIPDQIEAGTLMIATAATRGDVIIKSVIPTHMDALSAKLQEMGVVVEEGDDYIHVSVKDILKHVAIKTMPYPGFPTDLQQPTTVLLSTADGTSIIVENIFESRFKHIEEIRRMGANVSINGQVAIVEGVSQLTGAPVRATDLRAGAALIVAGLMADGKTEISNTKYIDRGYDNIDKKLISLGANIKRLYFEEEEEEDLI